MRTTGRVWRFGDDVDTDVITPGRMNLTDDPEDLRDVLFAETRPELTEQAEPGDVIVAGENFGCGSSRESAAWAPKVRGLGVIAASIARIYYRNAVNVGLPVLRGDPTGLADGHVVTVDWSTGEVRDETIGETLTLDPPEGLAGEIVRAGGVAGYLDREGSL